MIKSQSIKLDWTLLGSSVACILLGGFLAINDFRHRQELVSFKRTATTTTGIVNTASYGYKSRDDSEPPSISYSFSVNGKEYTGESEEFVPVGETVRIFYAPNDPTKNLSVAHIGSNGNPLLIMIFLVLRRQRMME